MRLTLSWPPSVLNPNARANWRTTARAKKAMRTCWAYEALEQGARRLQAQQLQVAIEFCPPADGRRRDTDNMLASCKAGLDGLAGVLDVDDSNWRLSIATGAPVLGGAVHIVITPVEVGTV